jgi:hypothetical protein
VRLSGRHQNPSPLNSRTPKPYLQRHTRVRLYAKYVKANKKATLMKSMTWLHHFL